MANPLSTLETDLAALATPPSSFPAGYTGGGTAQPTPVLTAVQTLFSTLETVGAIQASIGPLASGINSGLGDAAAALETIASQLQHISDTAGAAGTDATSVLASLQNALATAGSLIPGGTNVTQLQSGSQFFGQLSTLLSDLGSITAAVTCLYQIAQQLRAIGSLPS